MVMGREAQFQPGAADRGDVGGIQILLPQMEPVRALIHGDLPVVIHHQRGTVLAREDQALADFSAQGGVVHVLEAQLHQFDAKGQGAFQPCGGIEDRDRNGAMSEPFRARPFR